MAPTKRRSTRQQNQDDAPSSDPAAEGAAPTAFRQQISWTVGRPIPEGELIKRLQALHNEMNETPEESVDLEALKPRSADLISDRLLKHKSRAVQTWTALCLVKVIELFVPDPPYNAKELKNFFTFIIETTIPAIADPTSPYHGEHVKVLTSLGEVNSILLIHEAQSSSYLIKSLIAACFDAVSGSHKNTESEISLHTIHGIADVLAKLVYNSESLSDEAIDVILAQFLRADPRTLSSATATKGKKGSAPLDDKQATLLLKDPPTAYSLAQDVCNGSVDVMARYVLRYFSAILADTSMVSTSEPKKLTRRKTNDDEDVDDTVQGSSEEELMESRKAHSLLRELWRASPGVLQEIIPQIENELATENMPVRLMAVETIGDMIAGIGSAGIERVFALDPAAYPSQSLVRDTKPETPHFLLTPSTSVVFIKRYHSTFQAFLSRRNDKSAIIRAAWATAVGKILQTRAGGAGLDNDSENLLLGYFAAALVDSDEKVRHSVVTAISQFSFPAIIERLGRDGGLSKEGTVLANLSDRAKDPKTAVRVDAIQLLGRIWGVAAGAIAAGDEHITDLLGGIPAKLLSAYFVNDQYISKSLDHAMFESLVPLAYPPKARQPATQDASKNGDSANGPFDADRLRVERILLMVSALDAKAKNAFFLRQRSQVTLAKVMQAFLQTCEEYNGGVVDPDTGKSEKEIETHLNQLIVYFAQTLPEKQKAIEDLKKFAKQHDRRCYALIRFCLAADSDWSKIRKSIREISKRIEETTPSTSLPSTMLDTVLTLLYRCSLLIFNKSNVPAIIHYSRTDEKGLGAAAHEMMKEISKTQGEIFSSHVQELCKTLSQDAPTASKSHPSSAVEDLKACAEFAQKFPEKMPQDRKFFNALMSYAEYGSPRAAKYAVRILLTTAAKKDMYSQDVYNLCTKNFKYGSGSFLSQLSALSQLMLYGSSYLEKDAADLVLQIAVDQVLTNPAASPAVEEKDDTEDWSDEPDDHITAKSWALKILVNRLQSYLADVDITEPAKPVFKFLSNLVVKKGEIPSKATASKASGPKSHASRLRLLAATCLLKLGREQRFNEKITPVMFNKLAVMTQDEIFQVREGFVKKLIKYLGQNKLAKRFYTPLFLLAFEPVSELKITTETWLRGRVQAFAREKDMSMELMLVRLISLLSHHQDFDDSVEGLQEIAAYFIYFLRPVATRDNISLIFYLSQRIKSVSDGINPAQSDRLYILSDLAQALIRRWDERHDWNMHTWPTKVNLPAGIYAPLEKRDMAAAIAAKIYLPEEVLDGLDAIVNEGIKVGKSKKKNKAAGDTKANVGKKRARAVSDSTKKTATPNTKKARTSKSSTKKKVVDDDDTIHSADRRRSGRHTKSVVYAESGSDAEEGAQDNEGTSKVNGSAKKNKGKSTVEISSDVEMSDEDD